MGRYWTFSQKIVVGFAITVILSVVMGAVGIYALRQTVIGKDRVIHVHAQLLLDAANLQAASYHKGSASRGYLLMRDEKNMVVTREAHAEVARLLDQLRNAVVGDEERAMVERIARLEEEHQQALDGVMALRGTDAANLFRRRACVQERDCLP